MRTNDRSNSTIGQRPHSAPAYHLGRPAQDWLDRYRSGRRDGAAMADLVTAARREMTTGETVEREQSAA